MENHREIVRKRIKHKRLKQEILSMTLFSDRVKEAQLLAVKFILLQVGKTEKRR